MNPTFLARAFMGLVAGAFLVGVVKWAYRDGTVDSNPIVQPVPLGYLRPAPPMIDVARADAAMEIARLEDRVKELETKLAEDPRRTRGRDLARALGAAARAGWTTDEAKKADAELVDFLAGLARDAGVDAFEFALNPERDALFAGFLAGFGLPLDEAQAAQISALLDFEAKRWAEWLELRKSQTTIERLGAVYAEAADFEARVAAILTEDQLTALSHRFENRYRSRNPRPWADRNNVLGPREAPKRQLYGSFAGDDCYNHWRHEFLEGDGGSWEAVKFYAEWYEREMLGLEKPADLSGDKTVPPGWRAKQVKVQADVQKKMLEDARFGEGEKKKIREWERLYDPGK